MAVYNTSSDSANTAVRAFLTKVGEYYLGHSFNTGSGTGKRIWNEIRDNGFNSCCAYCGASHLPLQIEHLFMFNRNEYGLHHPGNIVPCCKECNKRSRNSDGNYLNWEEHLKAVCQNKSEEHLFEQRKSKILSNFKKHGYPDLTDNEKNAIRVIANSLYENIKTELDKSLNMYKDLDEAFIK